MIEDIVKSQKEFFQKGNTLDVDYRIMILKQLKTFLFDAKDSIVNAFYEDYHKCEFDVMTTEFSMVIMEIDYMIKNIKKFAKVKKVKTDMVNFPSKGYIHKEPYGNVLIMAPWNYPLQLSLTPLIGAIASGNTVVLKPSNYAPKVAKVLYDILSRFDERLISVVLGGREANATLLDQKFDYIFFTGGDTVGRIVLEKAAVHLTPVTLELGGKSPCIIDEDSDLKKASKRVVWGKFLNAGQTCVAPDYIYVNEKVKDEFINLTIAQIKAFYYKDENINDDFTHIINDKHVERLLKLIDSSKIIFGGKNSGRLIEPTILDNVTRNDLVMQEEIFGPIMPIMTFKNIDDVISELKELDKPLALYYFGYNKETIKKVLRSTSSGGVCINDTIMHLTNSNLPFGGVGRSGMGEYHGYKSFTTFSHEKSIFVKGKCEINIKYPPYTKKKLDTISKITKI